MPTPSSDQPPDPSSPPPFAHSTCPEDIQYPIRSPRQANTSQHQHGISSLDDPSLSGLTSQAGREQDASSPEGLILDRQNSTEPTSRATTVSPGPQSTTTETTSPVPSAPYNNIAKPCESGPDGLFGQSIPAAARRSPGRGSSASSLARDAEHQDLLMYDDGDDLFCFTSMGMDFPSTRAIPILPSSYLRPGSRFHGTQQSKRQVYDVQVEIKHFDMRESFLCGYLRIQGLTEDHPTLTTYFEGEIIGSKYGFVTQHEDWGASFKTDMNHWSKFSAFRPFQKGDPKVPVVLPDVAQNDNIFMRWKEQFLVPDHRVQTITGASFEGFYYICFNQIKGEVNGIYFHSKNEKFQQLELNHVPNRGCFSATEFR